MRALLSAFLISISCATAAPGPVESAMGFIRKLESGTLSLEPGADTAIAPEVSREKKQSILLRLQRLAQDIKSESIQPGPSMVNDSLAGVILRASSPQDPMHIRLLPFAMVREGEIWRVAPVPASFENTTANYSRTSRDAAREIELWLAREQTAELERFRKSAADALRTFLSTSLSPQTIQSWSSDQFLKEFLSACDQHDIPRILALTGGLSDPHADDFQSISAAAKNAIAAPSSDIWSLLTSPAVLKIPLSSDNEENLVHHDILFLDPRNPENSTPVYQTITISKDRNALWIAQVPDSEPLPLSQNDAKRKLKTLSPLSHPLPSAEELKNKLLAALQSNSPLSSWLPFLILDGNPDLVLANLIKAAAIRWQTLDSSSPVIPVEMAFLQENDQAFLAVQWLSLGILNYSSRVFVLQKRPEGWLWNPSPDLNARTKSELATRPLEDEWKNSYLRKAVDNCPVPDTSLPPPTEQEALKLAQNWQSALASSSWQKALSLCARLETEKSPAQLLRNLGHECRSAHQNHIPRHIDPPLLGTSVALLAIRPPDASQSSTSLLPVVSTTAGPRILMEIDLGDPARPGRAFLNRNALARLSAAHPNIARELESMIAQIAKAPPK